ncbi:MAG: efflux RND transporter periplasmic adaptor subunit [Dyella sp.]
MRPLPLLFAAALLGLVGCSHDNPTSAPTTTPANNYVAMARGRVDVEGGLLELAMPREGVVTKVLVQEGDQVKQGQLLATLDDVPAKLAVSAAQAEQQQAQAQLQLLNNKLKAMRVRAHRLSAAAAAGAGDGQSADDAHDEVQQLTSQRLAAQASLAQTAQTLASARYALEQRSLRAPIAGQIVHRAVQPGASVNAASDNLFTLLPQQPRLVRAELNESFVGAVVPGMRAQVIDDSGHAQTPIPAHVLRIGQVFSSSTLEEDPLVRANTRTVECIVVFDAPAGQQLRIGQRVLVQFGPQGAPLKP